MIFAALVTAALDAVGRVAGCVDAQDAALNVAILAEVETRRGVRTVRG